MVFNIRKKYKIAKTSKYNINLKNENKSGKQPKFNILKRLNKKQILIILTSSALVIIAIVITVCCTEDKNYINKDIHIVKVDNSKTLSDKKEMKKDKDKDDKKEESKEETDKDEKKSSEDKSKEDSKKESKTDSKKSSSTKSNSSTSSNKTSGSTGSTSSSSGSSTPSSGTSGSSSQTHQNQPSQSTTVVTPNGSAKELDVVSYINQLRNYLGMSSLAWDNSMYNYAKTRANEIAVSYSHTRPNGQSSIYSAPVKVRAENIGYGQSSAQEIFTDWKNSSSHYSNLTNSSFSKVAVAYAIANGTYYWVFLAS